MSGFQLIAGFLLAISISSLAWKKQALSTDGAFAASILGTLVFGLGGFPWAILLLTFFLTSSSLSRFLTQRKSRLKNKFSKGHRRDWAQVAANGGLSILFILLQTLLPQATWPWWAYAGALATVNADTWATELGTLSKTPPRLITTGKIVENGTSGGISLTGTLAALAGGTLIGGVAGLFPAQAGVVSVPQTLSLLGLVAFAGLAGSLFDSLLGATLQAIYLCPNCQKKTEHHPVHTCGSPTKITQGLTWLNNDGVNFAASILGALIAAIGSWLL